MNLFSLSGQTALVTGSSQGIGFALAQGLADAGARLILNGRDRAKLDQAAEQLQQKGCTVLTSAFDVTDHQACLLYTSPSPRDRQKSRMPSSA